MINELLGIQNVIDVISLALQSSFISNEDNGLSLMLIAKPETAKTTSIFKFNGLKHVAYYDEITQKKLIDEFLPFVRNNQKKTIMIPDLINCTEKQKSTRDQFLNILKSGIDDNGLVQIATAFKTLAPNEVAGLIKPLKFNIITATTYSSFKQIEKFLKETGLSSRLVMFSYDYPISTINKIMAQIRGEKFDTSVKIPKVITEMKEIKGDAELFKSFELLAGKIAQRYEGYGIRALTNLIRLSKANAMLCNRNKVTQADIDKVLQLANWMNLDNNIMS